MIELKNISKSFGSRAIIKNFSFTINDGDYVCFHGPSGCGKTTLLNIIGLIEDYDCGEVLYDGLPVNNRRKRMLLDQRISFIFQNFGLIDDKRVYDNFEVIKSLRNKARSTKHKLIDEALTAVGLPDIGQKYIYELSGGEQQRIAIAKAFLKHSSIILADEPTASLDDHNQRLILDKLRTMNGSGCTIITVSHDQLCIDEATIKINLEREVYEKNI